MKKIQLSILIPVYNEEKTVLSVLKRTTSLDIDSYEVLVVDDGSKDKSSSIIADFQKKFTSKQCTLRIFTHEKNKGKGSGIQTALKHAEGEYFVVQDADLEYDPEDIQAMIRIAEDKKIPVLYGSRFLGDISAMPKANYLANRGYNILLRALYDTGVTDMHTCYKMVKTDIIKSFNLKSAGFEYATELIGNILSKGIPIEEAPISFHGRTKKEGKKIDTMDGIICAKQIVTDYLKFKGYYGELATLIKFLIVGTFGFAINYVSLRLLQDWLGIENVLISSTISTLFAINITFLIHNNWTYRSNRYEKSESNSAIMRYKIYILSNIVGVIMTISIISIAMSVLNVTRMYAVIIASLIVLLWNYTVNKVFIWKIRPRNKISN